MIDDRTLLDDWHAVARTQDIDSSAPYAARLLEEDLLLWRSANGVEAWRDRCPHRGAKLSLGSIRDGRVVCPYHGLEFEAGGRCARVPAHPDRPPPDLARAACFKATERYGLVWVSLGEPAGDVPPVPESEDETYAFFVAGRFEIGTSGYRAIENFLDLAHFPFVHPGLLGEESHPEVADYDVEITPDGLVVDNARFWQPKPTNTLDLDGVDAMREAIVLTFAPIDEESGIGWLLLASNYDEQYSQEEVEEFTDLIIGQDLRIIESQRPRRLPIHDSEEFSVPADRTSVYYRRWLRSLGVTYGTT